jgi:hypothetical protein
VAQSVLLPEPAASTLPRQHAARAVPSQPGLRLPLLYKVLLANASIVLLGAVAGTWATMAAMRAAGEGGGMRLGAALAVLGLLLSIATNYVVLRAAFRPLTALAKVAEAVRAGDLSARAEPLAGGDPRSPTWRGVRPDPRPTRARPDRAALARLAGDPGPGGGAQAGLPRAARRHRPDPLRPTAPGDRAQGIASADVRATATALEETTVEALEGVRGWRWSCGRRRWTTSG